MKFLLRFLENIRPSKRNAEHLLKQNRLAEAWSGLFTPSSLDEYQVQQWKTPLALAVAIHLVTFALSLLPPSLFQRDYEIPEYLTVDLFNVTEVQPPPPPAPVDIEPAKAKIKVASIPKPPPPKAVSTAPLKPKPKKAKEEEKSKSDELLRQRLEYLQAQLREKEAMERARDVAQDAVSKIKDLYQLEKAKDQIKAGPAAVQSEQRGSYSDLSAAEKQYWAAVTTHIQSFWTLPDLQNWEKNLKAVYVVHINKDGTLLKGFFEKKSENYYFNQFVERTIQNAVPLPSFPPQVKKAELEIGLVFHPGGLW